MSKYSITLHFEGLTKQVSEIVLLHFGDIQLPNYKGTGQCCSDIIISNHSDSVLGASGTYSMKVCLVTPM